MDCCLHPPAAVVGDQKVFAVSGQTGKQRTDDFVQSFGDEYQFGNCVFEQKRMRSASVGRGVRFGQIVEQRS